MKKSRRICLLLTLFTLVLGSIPTVAFAQSEGRPNPLETRRDDLDRLGWLVGGVWQATNKAEDGTVTVTEVEFRPVARGNGVAYTITRSDNDYVVLTADGIFGWHPGKNTYVGFEVDSMGVVTESQGRFEGDALVFDEALFATGRNTLDIRATIRRGQDNTFRFEAQRKGAGGAAAKSLIVFDYVRLPAEKAKRIMAH